MIFAVLGCSRDPSPNVRQHHRNDRAPRQAQETPSRTEHIFIPPVFAEESPILQRDIVVRNDSPNVVRIDRVAPSCGCTTPTLSEKVILAGGHALLTVGIDALGRLGTRTVNVALHTDRGEIWDYRITFHVYRRFRTVTESLHLGETQPNQALHSTFRFELAARQSEPVPMLKQLRQLADDVTLLALPETVTTDDNGIIIHTIPVRTLTTAKAIPGAYSAPVSFEIETGNGALSQHTATLDWRVTAAIAASPKRVFFRLSEGDATPGTSQEIGVRSFSSNDSPPFEIRSVRPTHHALHCTHLNASVDRSYTFTLSVDPAQFGRTLFASVEIETTDLNQPCIVVPVVAVKQQNKSSASGKDSTTPSTSVP